MQRRSSQKTKTRSVSRATPRAATKTTSTVNSAAFAGISSISTGRSYSSTTKSSTRVSSSVVKRSSRPSATVQSKKSITTLSISSGSNFSSISAPSKKFDFQAPTTTTSKRSMSDRAVPGKIYFSTDHEYLKFDTPTTAYVGISDHAQEALGEIVFVDLPKPGTIVEKGQSFAAVESVKSANDIYAPVSMEILKVNTDLENEVSLINEDAQGKGWLLHVNVRDLGEVDQLMDEDAYGEFCNH